MSSNRVVPCNAAKIDLTKKNNIPSAWVLDVTKEKVFFKLID